MEKSFCPHVKTATADNTSYCKVKTVPIIVNVETKLVTVTVKTTPVIVNLKTVPVIVNVKM